MLIIDQNKKRVKKLFENIYNAIKKQDDTARYRERIFSAYDC